MRAFTAGMCAKAGVLAGVDLNYPFLEADLSVQDVAAALRASDLTAVSVTPIIYGREFRSGSFTNANAAIRTKALGLAHESVDAARRLGVGYVKFWPGQDGYDYPFQVDYTTLRRHGIEGIRDVARNFPDITFGIEYKLKEPRTRLLWSTAAASLLGIERMGVDNVGLVVDFGHSLFAKENPAEALSLAHDMGWLVDIEVDDGAAQHGHDALAAQRLVLLPITPRTLSKRHRVIVNTDAKNEADDQYAIVHALLSPSLDIRGIIPAGLTDSLSGSTSPQASRG